VNPEPFSALSLQLLSEGISIRFRVAGLSMEPAIRDGDLVTVEPRSSKFISEGEIVLYRFSGRLTAHRVRDQVRKYLICQGDSWSHRPEIVPSTCILGVVTGAGDRGDPPTGRSPMIVLVIAISRFFRSFAAKSYRTIYGILNGRHATISTGVGSRP
jgi:hypothetical protein